MGTFVDSLLVESRITPTGNGISNGISSGISNIVEDSGGTNGDAVNDISNQVTSGQKWWAAVVLGFVFFIISSPVAYHITSQVTLNTIGSPLMYGTGPTLAGLLVHTIIFVLIVRLILW